LFDLFLDTFGWDDADQRAAALDLLNRMLGSVQSRDREASP
jgi:hypothetical protein